MQAVDLGVTIDNVDYKVQDEELLETIAGLRGILFCGGNQIRLVETLLHRGEESAVLRAIARAHSRGATLIAASGAASALSGVMIAGGSSWEALRYGVSSDTGHRGLVIQEGIGLFGGGIVDQNLSAGNRLGRLIVACAEESERFGIGVFEDSAAVASRAGTVLEAAGRHGFLLVEIDPTTLRLQNDSFVAENVRLTVVAPGERLDAAGGDGGADRAGRGRGRAARRAARRAGARGRACRPPAAPRRRSAGSRLRRPRAGRRLGGHRPRVPARPERLRRDRLSRPRSAPRAGRGTPPSTSTGGRRCSVIDPSPSTRGAPKKRLASAHREAGELRRLEPGRHPVRPLDLRLHRRRQLRRQPEAQVHRPRQPGVERGVAGPDRALHRRDHVADHVLRRVVQQRRQPPARLGARHQPA